MKSGNSLNSNQRRIKRMRHNAKRKACRAGLLRFERQVPNAKFTMWGPKKA